MNSNSSKGPNISLDEHLHEDTRLWLNTLPRNVEPKALAAQFPRLANDIANLWLDATACGKFIDSLLFGTRNGTRDGFPYEVAFELSYLKVLTVYRTGQLTLADDANQINIRQKNH